MTRPFCVALTGGIASGKSTAADGFAMLGAQVIDTDRIAHALAGPGGRAIKAIVAAFGEQVLGADGGLDRPRMRRRAFADGDLRKRLEAILHPLIRAEVAARLGASTAPYVVIVVPLWVEAAAAYRQLVDRVLVVDCPEDLQLHRAMRRDGMDEALARQVLAAQADRQTRLAHADDVLRNDGSHAELLERVRVLHETYREFAANRVKNTRHALP